MRISDWSSDVCSSDLAEAEGVQVTSSGLQYKVLGEGEGPRPTARDIVLVHYEGRLTDGTVFDSSYQRRQPAAFPLRGLIPGWTEGIQLMPTGSKYRFWIPPELGYGAEGAGDGIIRSEEHTSELQSLMRISYAV